MKIYNTLSRKIEKFESLSKNEVSIYVCGITPYDTTHLGHAFVYISFDAFIRYLKYKGYKVNYTQNVTDIDDDILKRAKEENINWKTLGKFWTDKFLNDLSFLNVLPPNHFVKATDSIPRIIEIVKSLVDKDFAYEKEGNVYFNIKKFKNYGVLSKYSQKQMILISKERGGYPNDPLKINPLDFVLWQKTKKSEPFWESPWGKGRPGWHIECSAMIHQYLGERIDIHGGGRDLIYPHHESEIAQSESFTGKKPFVGYWMHIAMLLYEGEKMSKSLGNIVMVSDLSKTYSSNAIRWMLLSNHYRTPWEFDLEKMENAKNKIKYIEKAINKKSIGKNTDYTIDFEKLMDNDFDTPGVLNLMYELSLKINQGKENSQESLKKIYDILGFK